MADAKDVPGTKKVGMTGTVDRTGFRTWFEDCLRGLRGRKVEWPQLLRRILAEKVEQVRCSPTSHKGAVFTDRDSLPDGDRVVPVAREKIHVRHLYRLAHEQGEGLLKVGQEEVWPVSWELPSQGGQGPKKTLTRRGVLLGLRRDGSLVVFECRGPGNSRDSPLSALLEGANYLGWLLTARNRKKLTEGFRRWRDKDRGGSGERFVSWVPPAFRDAYIRSGACHKVVVLAPAEYYRNHERDSRGLPQDWWFLSDRFWDGRPADRPPSRVGLDFATTDFSEPACALLALPWLERL